MALTLDILFIIDKENVGRNEISKGLLNNNYCFCYCFCLLETIMFPYLVNNFDNSTAVCLSSVVLVCISVAAPLDVVDSVIVETPVETINVKLSGQCDFNISHIVCNR